MLTSVAGLTLNLLFAGSTAAEPSAADAAARGSKRQAAPAVRVIERKTDRRVDVTIGGQPFTSYLYGLPGGRKPVLWPLRSARGTAVTRGFPLEPRPGERVDHPHHVGLWFNYGDVNGVDFWNNSDAKTAEEQKKMGTILHRSVVRARGGAGKGELAVTSDWQLPDGRIALREETAFTFSAGPSRRAVDRVATLTAGKEEVRFDDNKEGLVALRLARFLEHPSKNPEVFLDASGKPTAVPKLDNSGVTGLYRSSEGKEGDAVWGTRGRWVMLTGKSGDEAVAVVILDHPNNPGHPTYWHARGYGLFAANPLGAKVFTKGAETTGFKLAPGASARFAYRVVILSGTPAVEEIEREYGRFVAELR